MHSKAEQISISAIKWYNQQIAKNDKGSSSKKLRLAWDGANFENCEMILWVHTTYVSVEK